MGSSAWIDWNGDAVIERVRKAAVTAVNETVDEAADDARVSHWWRNRTGQLEEELVSEHAKPGDANPTAKFGTTQRRGFYGLFHEYQTPFLRPAADRHFGGLASKIRRRLER